MTSTPLIYSQPMSGQILCNPVVIKIVRAFTHRVGRLSDRNNQTCLILAIEATTNLKTVNLTVYTWRSVCKPVWTPCLHTSFANRSFTSPMASSALQHWTASPTKEGCHWQAGMTGLLLRTFKTRSKPVLLKMYKSVVRPSFWSRYYKKDKELLEKTWLYPGIAPQWVYYFSSSSSSSSSSRNEYY